MGSFCREETIMHSFFIESGGAVGAVLTLPPAEETAPVEARCETPATP